MNTPQFIYPSLFSFAVLAIVLAILNLFGGIMMIGSAEGTEKIILAGVLTCAALLILAVIDIRKRLKDRP